MIHLNTRYGNVNVEHAIEDGNHRWTLRHAEFTGRIYSRKVLSRRSLEELAGNWLRAQLEAA